MSTVAVHISEVCTKLPGEGPEVLSSVEWGGKQWPALYRTSPLFVFHANAASGQGAAHLSCGGNHFVLKSRTDTLPGGPCGDPGLWRDQVEG